MTGRIRRSMRSIIISTAVLALCFSGCKDLGTSPSSAPLSYPVGIGYHFYDYVAYDTLNGISARGSLTLSIVDFHVTGSWRFDDGRSGRLKGTYGSASVAIDLYPDSTETKLLLSGDFPNNVTKGFSGQWTMTRPNGLESGNFVATYNHSVILE